MSMTIAERDWKRIRNQFSEDEKAKINDAITGQTICPMSATIDEWKLDTGLREKLVVALAQIAWI